MAVDYEDRVTAAHTCSVCGREFTPRERYLSALFEQGEQFLRRDYCTDCWQGPPEGSFSHWRGRMPAAEERPQRFVEDGDLLDLFVRLEGVREPRRAAFRYLLGLLLVRRRLLKLEGSGGRRGEPMVLVERGGGGRYQVPTPRLSPAELAEVAAQMGVVLRVDVKERSPKEEEGSDV